MEDTSTREAAQVCSINDRSLVWVGIFFVTQRDPDLYLLSIDDRTSLGFRPMGCALL